jgi:AcrR family transcriptional regulator
MAQQLKEDVRDRIVSAALDVFAAKGFRASTMAEIAQSAGISTGNIYRYFPDKETLFHFVAPPSFAAALLGLLRRRVRSLDGVNDITGLGTDSPFSTVSEELLSFSIGNRKRVIILLGRGEGTRYQPFAGQLAAELRRLAIGHYRSLGRDLRVAPAQHFALERIYRNWVRTMVEILAASDRETVIRERVEAYSRYHLAGLNALFG